MFWFHCFVFSSCLWIFEDKHQVGSVKMLSKSHQLDQLDDAGRGLEVPDVESDLEGLGVGAGVRHHRHVSLHLVLQKVPSEGS